MLSLGVTPDDLATISILEVPQPSFMESYGIVIINVIPFLLIAGFLVLMLRQAQSGNNQAMSFGKSRARMVHRRSAQYDVR